MEVSILFEETEGRAKNQGECKALPTPPNESLYPRSRYDLSNPLDSTLTGCNGLC